MKTKEYSPFILCFTKGSRFLKGLSCPGHLRDDLYRLMSDPGPKTPSGESERSSFLRDASYLILLIIKILSYLFLCLTAKFRFFDGNSRILL